MKTSKKIYEHLRKQYTDEEIVESVVFNETLDKASQQAVDTEFRALRLQQIQNRTNEERLLGALLQMKYTWQDYFKIGQFDTQFSFANQFKVYIKNTGRSHKAIAENLAIHPTKLSRIINERESPNIELMYRLAEHSGNQLPAHYWWRLHALQLEYRIKTDLQTQLEEASKVKAALLRA